MRRRDETISRRRDSYHVSEPGVKVNGKGYSDGMLALIAAQIRLEKGIGESESGKHEPSKGEFTAKTLLVTRQSLFGPTVVLYRVERVDGAVLTYTVEAED